MKAKEKALKALSEYSEEYREIDLLIEPLCKLLTEQGYITMHSCSTHVKVQSCKISTMVRGVDISKEEDKWIHHKHLQWYILFIATVPISDIRKVVEIVNKKYNYGLYYDKVNSYEGITRRWKIEKYIDSSFKDKDVYELNKNIYLEFKDYFAKKDLQNNSSVI